MSLETVVTALAAVRQQKPLVVNITNTVVMNNTANALLAIGASPIMAHSTKEMTELMAFANALVINIGTLDSSAVPRMIFAIEQANINDKPVVLDPVGCGASFLRLATSKQIAELANNLIIRANASEVIALAGGEGKNKGVDALDSSKAAVSAAKHLVDHYQCNVVVSGATDFVVTAKGYTQLKNGDAMMPYVTGMGCTMTALTGAFAAIGEETGLAAAAVLGVAGEIAAAQSKGPGSLQVNLLDVLYHLDQQSIIQRLKLS